MLHHCLGDRQRARIETRPHVLQAALQCRRAWKSTLGQKAPDLILRVDVRLDAPKQLEHQRLVKKRDAVRLIAAGPHPSRLARRTRRPAPACSPPATPPAQI